MVAIVVAVIGVTLTAPSGVASAHPLGNFSVSHLNTITLESDRVVIDTVIDAAEIPTAQDRPSVDLDGDGSVDRSERATRADTECELFAQSSSLVLDGASLDLVATETSFAYEAGQAGLQTSRLTCRFQATVSAGFGSSEQRVEFADTYRPGRVGWHEINAVAVDVGIVDSPVPTSSVTDGLRSYPDDLLSSPLDVRSVTLAIGPTGSISSTIPIDEPSSDAANARDDLVASRPGVLGSVVDGVQERFDDLIGRQDLTVGVGLLAIGLSLVLGASHALLPGHGKTVMAAYIAGRQGTARDAVVVGATVTATHTGGVLLLGLGLTVSTALAGETVLNYLGVVSGLLIAALGLAMLVSAVRRRDEGWLGHGHHHHEHGGHTHDEPVAHHVRDLAVVGAPAEIHSHYVHSCGAGHPTRDRVVGDPLDELVRGPSLDDHEHHVHHEHSHEDDHSHDAHPHLHSHDGHAHDDGHEHEHHERVSRRGLMGMGVAGGLVPSPSALIVLLSAIALGRTWFGIVLVIGYGVGMAVVLTLAGLLLVGVRNRLRQRLGGASGRISAAAQRWTRLVPMLTALLVLVVGAGLAIRSITTI
jgi:ABC-type nickel/cobalt efflux system permease component RcnA